MKQQVPLSRVPTIQLFISQQLPHTQMEDKAGEEAAPLADVIGVSDGCSTPDDR